MEHVSHHLPIIVGEFLQNAFDNERSRLNDPSFIADCFSRSIVAFDNAIAGDVLDLFGGVEGLANYTDAQIRQIINDQHKGGSTYRKARLNMYGTTALIALIDPSHQNLWIANLGDCQASTLSFFLSLVLHCSTRLLVLVSPKSAEEWDVKVLTNEHNGDNDAEVERVRNEHANEPECVIDRRVLGALHPFRCLGDTPFKQPPEFTRRILYNLLPGFHDTSPWEEFLVRNRTPPYISAQPEISHVALDDLTTTTPSSISTSGRVVPGSCASTSTASASSSPPSLPRFLVLTSDGFTDLCSTEGQQQIISDWARGVVGMHSPDRHGQAEAESDLSNINNILPMSPLASSYSQSGSPPSPHARSHPHSHSLSQSSLAMATSAPALPGHESRNMALRLLRRALGGYDRASVSRVLTLDMDGAWIDDTSIVVQTL